MQINSINKNNIAFGECTSNRNKKPDNNDIKHGVRTAVYNKGETKGIDVTRLSLFHIPNLSTIGKEGARGETLSSPKNRKFLPYIKKCGIQQIIDLREKYTSESYPELCKENGLDYIYFPINSDTVSDREIIDKMPEFFNAINEGHYYIACAQGLHRTDIALAVNYVFNPKNRPIPILKGHIRDEELKSSDIKKRLNSLKSEMTPEDLQKIGWDDNFEEEFEKRKENLFEFNKALANQTYTI